MPPVSSLRCNIQAYKDDQRDEKVLQWGNTFQFSAPPVTQTNPRKRAPGKIRARWSNKARYNPMKMKRPNTPDLPVTNMDMADSDKVKVPLSVKVCIPHPKNQTGQVKIGLGNKQKHRNQ